MGKKRASPVRSTFLLLMALQLFSATSSLFTRTRTSTEMVAEVWPILANVPGLNEEFLVEMHEVETEMKTRENKKQPVRAFGTLKEEQPQVHCSRERSRAAWKIIEEYLLPFVEREKYQLSSRCRLHPNNDIFRDQEEHKIHIDINDWQCGYCKKVFRAEKFLDQHFDNRHYNLLNVSHGKCLADLCGALHCDFVMKSQSRKTKCSPAAAARNRHLCEDLADSCFPVDEGPSVARLHEAYQCPLLGDFNIDFDAPSHILLDRILVSKRNEKGNTTA
ncbi:UNVERIFIED_CONTAM: hypothetical protein Sradi_0583400 [Sesamum radiatum]|uniref:C2H2-type domain-containing protein n=1 Tax=Sesamum radiatum TaxID=300843 RepID=A0AAW2VIJ8_SESRA